MWQGAVDTAIAQFNDWQHERVTTFTAYLNKHRHRIVNSGYYQAEGISIGSGAIESTVKQRGRRLQISGAQWEKDNVPQVLKHRSADLNGQFSKGVSQDWDALVEVSLDLSGNYKGLVHKLLPNATVVADRFHVMKIVNQDLDTARKTLRKANEQTADEVEKARIAAALKQSKYVLLKPEENLTQKQKVKLEEIRNVLPTLAQMHQQKEAFRAIFEQAKGWGEGTFQLLAWLAEAQESFQEGVGTIGRWFGEVTAYFDNRTTSVRALIIN